MVVAVHFRDQDEVPVTLKETGINRERMMSVDNSKVDEALEMIEVDESRVCDIDESDYVPKADVNEDQKKTRLQGLKDQLTAAEGAEAETLQREIEELEGHIEELTEFSSAWSFHTQSNADL